MNKTTTLITVIAAAVSLSSCCTIMHGSSQKIGISSTPPGAKVTVDGRPEGVTPVIVKLDRDDAHTIIIEKEGYEISTHTVTDSVSGWVWGNLVFGALPGLAIDAISGSLYTLDPENINVTLQKK